MQLWGTGNVDARFLAILIMKPQALSADQLEDLVRSIAWERVADWVNSYVVTKHSNKEALRQRWMKEDHPMVARAGWSLTTGRIIKSPEGLDLSALLDRIETEMGTAPPETQWTMNFSLVEIGVRFPEHRERALAIGEEWGLYRDYPEAKGCTSPHAPTWINEMVSRQSAQRAT